MVSETWKRKILERLATDAFNNSLADYSYDNLVYILTCNVSWVHRGGMPDLTGWIDKDMLEAALEGHLMECILCRELFDGREFDQVAYHANNPHRPIEATGITGERVEEDPIDELDAYKRHLDQERMRELETIRRMKGE